VPQALVTDDVLGIAITADKRDCVGVLKFASRIWLQPRDKDTASDLILLPRLIYSGMQRRLKR
jgi:hypothetical protein